MKAINLVLILLFLPCIAYAVLDIEYPVYGDVNETERVKVFYDCEDNDTLRLIGSGLNDEMICFNDEYYYLDITNDLEVDDKFIIYLYNTTVYDYYNFDNTSEDTLIIQDSSIYGFNFTHNHSHPINSSYVDTFCSDINVITQPVTFTFFERYIFENGSFITEELDTVDVPLGEQTLCYTHENTITAEKVNFTGNYHGFRCNECQGGNPAQQITVELDIDTTLNYNNSLIGDNSTDTNITIYDGGNFAMYTIHSLGIIDESEEFTIFWRVPFTIDVSFFTSDSLNNTNVRDYSNEFQYVIMQFSDGRKVEDYFLNTLDFANEKFGGLFGINERELDTTLSFWADYSVNPSQIKLYESGNYSISLLTTDYKTNITWDEEFIYPQSKNDKYFSNVVYVEVTDEVNQEADIYIDSYEISKFNFIMNIFKVILVFIVWLVVIGIITSFGGVKLGGIVAGVTLPLALKLLGVF